MHWVELLSTLGGIIAALVLAIGLLLASRKRKKGGSQKVGQFLDHLLEIGVKASLAEKGGEEGKVGVAHGWGKVGEWGWVVVGLPGERCEGAIRMEGKHIDYVNVGSATSQYVVHYFLDYFVRNPSQSGKKRQKKTEMVRKKRPAIWGRVVDIEWKGDVYLSQQLNLSYRLKDILLQTDFKKLEGYIEILPEPKYEYARVRTTYLLPSTELFEAIDIIAGHIRSW